MTLDQVTAIGTLCVAVIVFWYSRSEAHKLRDVTIRQMRAYVLIDNVTVLPIQAGYPIQFKIAIKNCGQTPATYLKILNAVMVLDSSLSSSKLEDSEDAAGTTQSDSPLGPSQILTSLARSPFDLSLEQLAEIREGKKIIYVALKAQYRDVFDIKRVTRMQSFIAPMSFEPGELTLIAPCDSGNYLT